MEGRLLLMAVLLGASALFSLAETAFFSLGPVTVGRLSRSRNPVDRTVAALLAHPASLLITILLGNLTANVAYFSLGAGLTAGQPGAAAAVLAWFGTLLGVVLCGEVVPKSLALGLPLAAARAVVLPILACHTLAAPLRPLVSLLMRLLLPGPAVEDRAGRMLLPGELAQVLEGQWAHFGVGSATAVRLREVLDLGRVRVREAMIPRVDLPAFEVGQGLEELQRLMRARSLAWVVACRGGLDGALGIVTAREAFLAPPGVPLEGRVGRVPFVPEVAPLAAAVGHFHRGGAAQALVVDEYGGVAGVLTLDRLLGEIFGELGREGEAPESLVAKQERGVWRVAGGLNLRAWLDRFAPAAVPPFPVETVGGLFLALTGRIPRQGDAVDFAGWRLRVLQVRRRRVTLLEARRLPGERREP